MTLLKIARMGHPVLLRPSEKIADPTARDIRRLVEDMIETMEDAQGVGMAAPQVHVSRRVIVFKAPAERIDAERIDAERIDAERIDAERIDAERIDAERIDAGPVDAERIDAGPVDAGPIDAERVDDDGEETRSVPTTALINPEFEPIGDEMALGWEGCLSIPGLTGAVPRFSRIRYRGMSTTGQAIEREAVGFHARVVQHEIDHLDGILYTMRMDDLGTLAFNDEVRRTLAEHREDE